MNKWERKCFKCLNKKTFTVLHNDFLIGRCLSGQGILSSNGKELQYRSQMFCLITPNFQIELHSTTKESVFEYVLMNRNIFHEIFQDDLLIKRIALKMEKIGMFCYSRKDYPDMARITQQFFEEIDSRLIKYEDLIQCYIKTFMIHYLRNIELEGSELQSLKKQDLYQYIEPAIEYMKEHYQESIRIPFLAELCHVSESYFRQIFYSNMGQAPFEYLNKIRAQKASELIIQTDYSMEMIACYSGFQSLAAFYRNFKKEFHCTPTQFKIRDLNHKNRQKNNNTD